jgi:hypothetical protein
MANERAGGGVRERPELLLPRHAGDLVRLAAAVALLVATAELVHRNRVAALEVDAFRLVNDLPGFLYRPVWVVMQLGNLLAVPAVAAFAVLTRRFRLAVNLLVAGVGVWFLAIVVKGLVERGRPRPLPPRRAHPRRARQRARLHLRPRRRGGGTRLRGQSVPRAARQAAGMGPCDHRLPLTRVRRRAPTSGRGRRRRRRLGRGRSCPSAARRARRAALAHKGSRGPSPVPGSAPSRWSPLAGPTPLAPPASSPRRRRARSYS